MVIDKFSLIIKRIFLITICLTIIVGMFLPATTYAMTDEQLKLFKSGINYFDVEEDCVESTGAGSVNVGSFKDTEKNAAIAWNYFLSKGLSGEQAAGILGNLQAESGIIPDKEEYSTGIGYGIAQWSFGRRDNLENYARQKGQPVGSLQLQLDFLWMELEGSYRQVLSHLRKANTVKAASNVFLLEFEKPANQSISVQNTRARFGEQWFKKFSNSSSNTVAANTSNNQTSSGGQTIVVIDPGHSGKTHGSIDQQSGIMDYGYYNQTETEDVFGVAKKLKNKLENAGYKVILTKNEVKDSPSNRERANVANNNQADIAISIHDDSTAGDFSEWGEVWPQKVGQYRLTGTNEEPSSQREKVKFTDENIASKSKQYAEKIKEARKKYEPSVKISQANFDERGGTIPPGNIPLVMLWSSVPWIYQESGGPLNDSEQNKYAEGLFDGIKSAIGPNEHQDGGSTTNTCGESNAEVQGDIVQTALNLAWNKKVEIPRTEVTGGGREAAKPEYVKAFDKYNKAPEYAGYTDCGKFVSTTIRASKVDPSYPVAGASSVQEPYVINHPDKYEKIPNKGNTSNLKPGDIFINDTHTFLYMGERGGSINIRQASWHTQVPNAPWSMSAPESDYRIYRVKM
jgi:N-acetylmuramoyl-L-alanine amidase